MKRHLLASFLMISTMQLFALPNLIGRWQTAPMWDRFEKTVVEFNFKDSINFDTKVTVDNTDFSEGECSTVSISGTYQLRDSLCILTADTSTFVATPAHGFGCDISEASGDDVFIIWPSRNSEDVIALVDRLNREVFILYRQK